MKPFFKDITTWFACSTSRSNLKLWSLPGTTLKWNSLTFQSGFWIFNNNNKSTVSPPRTVRAALKERRTWLRLRRETDLRIILKYFDDWDIMEGVNEMEVLHMRTNGDIMWEYRMVWGFRSRRTTLAREVEGGKPSSRSQRGRDTPPMRAPHLQPGHEMMAMMTHPCPPTFYNRKSPWPRHLRSSL